jgi:hypothetical protein
MVNLKVGDVVSWRGCFGSDAPKLVVVKGIEINCVNKSGDDVEEVPWVDVRGRSVILVLDNGSWCYGSQVKQTLIGSF